MGKSAAAKLSRQVTGRFSGLEAGGEEASSDIFTRATPVVDVPDIPSLAGVGRRDAALAAPRLPQEFVPPPPVRAIPLPKRPAVDVQRFEKSHEVEDATALAFWQAQPAYSEPPPVLASLPPRPAPSRLRLVLAKLLFVALFVPVLGLLLHVVSLKFDVPWLNMTTLWHSLLGSI